MIQTEAQSAPIENNINSQPLDIQEEHTLYSEPIFHINNFVITNSLLNSWIVVLFILIFALFIRRKLKLIPRGVQNIFEIIVDSFLNIFD